MFLTFWKSAGLTYLLIAFKDSAAIYPEKITFMVEMLLIKLSREATHVSSAFSKNSFFGGGLKNNLL